LTYIYSIKERERMTEKFVSPGRPPTPHERELLDILIEEAAEIIQRATKIKRFGVDEIQPGQPHDNAYRLGLEIGDLVEVVDRLINLGVVSEHAVLAGQTSKQMQLSRFLQTHPTTSLTERV
jgi:hypothetical protein